MQVELIAQYHCQTGEGPLWDADRNVLYWGDIPAGRLFRYERASDKHELIYEDRPVGGFTLQEDGALLLFRNRGNVVVWRDGKVVKTILEEVAEEVGTRWNDVAADPAGRVFGGTMAWNDKASGERCTGRFYRMDHDGTLVTIATGIGCSNGIGWSPDLSKMYYIDTPTREISVFDYDVATSAVSNRRAFVKLKGPPVTGSPDGMTVDAAGGVWCAEWGGSCVKHYGPDGALIERIDIPSKNVTSVMFGGPNLEELYITTAAAGDKESDPAMAGGLFRCVPGGGVRGKLEFRSRVGPRRA